jgi:O-antigen/teichoic acid export membrane protein
MVNPRQAISRLWQSAVVWSWVMNGLRLTSGLVVLPLLVVKLSKPDYDMYFVFLSLTALVPILDMGFAVSIGRAVSYAMGGAKELKAHGFVPEQNASSPNYPLLWQLLNTTRWLYRLLTLGALAILGVLGTTMVGKAVSETAAPPLTWVALGLTLASVLWDIYAGRWNVFLQNMNQVLAGLRIGVLAYSLRILLSCALLLLGAGLLSVPVAGLTSSCLLRLLCRRMVLRHLGQRPADLDLHQEKKLLSALWPNSWRVGLQFLSGYLAGQANTLICLPLLGLAASGTYGFSAQLIIMSSGMAQVWTTVKWPLIGQLRIQQDNAALRRLIWPRVWLQYLTHWVLAAAAILIVPLLLRWIHSEKTLLPPLWLGLLALVGFLEMNYSFWGTLISTENRTPFVWPIITSNFISFLLVLLLLHTTELGIQTFVLAPLVVGSLFNYWKWPQEGARSIGTSWLRFLLTRGH